MSERIDEAKGNIKEGLGKVTGNQDMEAEGKAEHESAAAKREVKGVGNQVKGSVEEGLGKVTGDEETQARGTADRLKGDSQRTGSTPDLSFNIQRLAATCWPRGVVVSCERASDAALVDLQDLAVGPHVHDVPHALIVGAHRVVHHRTARLGVEIAHSCDAARLGELLRLNLVHEGLLGDALLEGRVHALVGLLDHCRRLIRERSHRRVRTIAARRRRRTVPSSQRRAVDGPKRQVARHTGDQGQAEQDATPLPPQADARARRDMLEHGRGGDLSTHALSLSYEH